MSQDGITPWGAVALMSLATWGAWDWYVERIWDTPEEGVALLITLAVIVGLGLRERRGPTPVPLLGAASWLLIYAAAEVAAPPLISTAIAVIALLWAVYRAFWGANPPLAFYGLAALSLPVLPSLQFVLGYPMRLISASLTVGFLKLQGLTVSREGTHLVWAGYSIQFDAPCSGVNLLWAGFMMAFMVCTLWRAGVLMTGVAVLLALILTIFANVLRAVSLFFIETKLFMSATPWWHEAVGLAAFGISSAILLTALQRLRAWEFSA